MDATNEASCLRAARMIARELGVRIDHPGTARLAAALGACRPLPAAVEVRALALGIRIIRTREHLPASTKRIPQHAEEPPAGR